MNENLINELAVLFQKEPEEIFKAIEKFNFTTKVTKDQKVSYDAAKALIDELIATKRMYERVVQCYDYPSNVIYELFITILNKDL